MALHEASRNIFHDLRRAGIFVLALTPFVLAPQRAQAADQTLLLDLQVNGRSIGKIGEFTLRDGVLMVRPGELREFGIQGPLVTPSLVTRNSLSAVDGLIALSDMSWMIWRLDNKTQTLYITVPETRLVPTLLEASDGAKSATAPGRYSIESGTGVTLNYDVAGTLAKDQKGATGNFDLRLYSPRGVFSSGALGFVGSNPGAYGNNSIVRLDSTYQFANVNTLRRYSLGDFITGGLSWTRPVRLAGAQVRSDFSMRPDLVTFPLPSLNGSVAVPSTVEVLSNGSVVLSQQVDPGPFQIPQLPVVSGAGVISMTVTNALGRQVVLTQPFYASSSLLAPGLKTFSLQAGAVRRNWGLISNDYGSISGIANYRRGLTSVFTVEGSIEATPGAAMAGVGGIFGVGHLGVLNFAAAGSAGSGIGGMQGTIGAQRIGRTFSFGGSAILANRNFHDVAAMNGEPVPRKQLNASAGLSLRRLGSIGVAYGGIDRDASQGQLQIYSSPAQRSQVLTASYSLQIRHVSLYANEFHDFAHQGGSGLQFGVTIPFGRRRSVSASAGSPGYGQMQAQQSASIVGEWGFQAYLSAGDTTHEFAQVQYKAPISLLTAGVDSTGGQTTFRLETQGAISLVDHGLFASNTIYDSFAIVDTSRLAHVAVLQENRKVGRTNSSGRLLVPDLRAFQINHLAIDPDGIPADATIDFMARTVRPQDRSGVIVRFPMRFSHGALLHLVNGTGVALPVGSTATLRATGTSVPVGFDGAAYVELLEHHNEVLVVLPDGSRCSAAFDYRPDPGEIPMIGPLRCTGQTQ